MDTAIPNGSNNKHPVLGRRKTRGLPKGHQLDLTSLAEVRELLGDRSRQPDLLIEHGRLRGGSR